MSSVLWERTDGVGLERTVFEATGGGHRISGTTLLISDGTPHEIRFSVVTDVSWRTLTVGAHVQSSGSDRRLALSADGEGSWSVSDSPLIELYGAIDIDLSWTPSTQTLAIRRLGLDVGQTAETTVAWIDFPGHDIARVTQTYTRLAEDRYRLEHGGSSGDVVVDDGGIVVDHPRGWRAVPPA